MRKTYTEKHPTATRAKSVEATSSSLKPSPNITTSSSSSQQPMHQIKWANAMRYPGFSQHGHPCARRQWARKRAGLAWPHGRRNPRVYNVLFVPASNRWPPGTREREEPRGAMYSPRLSLSTIHGLGAASTSIQVPYFPPRSSVRQQYMALEYSQVTRPLCNVLSQLQPQLEPSVLSKFPCSTEYCIFPSPSLDVLVGKPRFQATSGLGFPMRMASHQLL
jgi:hypothetical protein